MRAFSVHRFLSRSQTPADQQTDFLYSGTAGSLGTGLKLGLEIGSDMGLGRDRSGRKTMFDRAVLSTVFCAIALGSVSLISLTTPASADGDPDAYIEHSYREVPPHVPITSRRCCRTRYFPVDQQLGCPRTRS